MEINKNFHLPEKCMRGINCQPLALIIDQSNGFLCCGLNSKRTESTNIYTHCFKNKDTDTQYDYNEQDFLSTISIFAMAMNIRNHIARE